MIKKENHLVSEGDIFVCQGFGIFGWLVRQRNRLTGMPPYTHAGIITKITNEGYWLAEAIGKGFVNTPYHMTWFENRLKSKFYLIGKSKIPLKNLEKHIKNYEGRPYAWKDIANIFLYTLTGKYALKWSTGAKELICSEAVARILYDASNKKIDFVKEFGRSYDLIEPYHLLQSEQIQW